MMRRARLFRSRATVANEKALTQVRADKEREATDQARWNVGRASRAGAVALEVFNRVMRPDQIDKQLPDYHVTADDLLRIPEGTISEAGVRQNVAVGSGCGRGCAALAACPSST